MPIDTAAPFDAALGASDESKAICEGCGYRLIGLTANRCPECGRTFDPDDLMFARIPWLHRNHIGTLSAYLRTALLVSFRPGRFARELSRPPRINPEDGLAFRSVTLWIATASFGFVIAMLPLVTIQTDAVPPSFSKSLDVARLIHGGLATVLSFGAFYLFIRLATALPRIIRKHEVKDDLSSIHYYACAPLALLPVPGVALGSWFYLLLHRLFSLDQRFLVVSAGASLIWLSWVWGVTWNVARISGVIKGKRLLVLAPYLPMHWVIMFLTSFFLFMLMFLVANQAMRLLMT